MTRILLIEDHSALRRMLYFNLIKAGYLVFEAIHGADGVRQLRANPVDLVITDMLMPEMDGVEAIQQLRRVFSQRKNHRHLRRRPGQSGLLFENRAKTRGRQNAEETIYLPGTARHHP